MAESQVGLELFRVAEKRAASGDIAVAARFAERAREVFDDADEHDAKCAAGSLEGRLRLQSGDLATAESVFRWVRQEAVQHQLAERALAASTELGALYEMTGDLQRSLGCHQDVLQQYRDLDNTVGTANALGNVGRLLTRLGKPTDAGRQLAEALGLFEDAGQQAGAVNARICLGDLARSQGQLTVAKEHFERAVLDCTDPRANVLLAVALLNLGHTQRDLGDRDLAVANFAKSRRIAEDLGDKQGIARAHLGEAMVLADSTDPRSSIVAFEEAEAAFLAIGQPPSALAATVNRAAVLCRVGRLLEGRDALVHARDLLRSMGDTRGCTEVGLALCEVLIALGNMDEVDAILEESAAEPHGPRLQVREKMIRVRLLIRSGQVGEAAALYDSVVDIELSAAEQFALDLIGAELEVLLGHGVAADALFAALVDTSDAVSSARERAAVLMGRALSAMWSGDIEAAHRRYDSAAGYWQDLGEPMPRMQCELGRLRAAALLGDLRPDSVEEIAAGLRSIGAIDAAEAAMCCAFVMDAAHKRAAATGSNNLDDAAQDPGDEVMRRAAVLIGRGNKIAAFSELCFATALLDDDELANELLDLTTKLGVAVPDFVSRARS